MAKIKIFISSIQKEFAIEREALNEYILSDPLLGKFFDPFLFELLPASNQQPKTVYLKKGLKEPKFIQDDSFTTVLYQPSTGQATDEIEKVALVISGEMKRAEIQEELQLKHREHFVDNYMNPALQEGFVEMKYPNSPNHPYQRHTLTKKGETLKINLNNTNT